MGADVDNIRKQVEQANDRLRAGRIGVTLVLRGKQHWISLRGTFPPKPKTNRTQPYQQLIALKMKATKETIRMAENIAKSVGADLNLGQFNWAKWSDANPSEGKTVGDWLNEFEEFFWRNNDRNNPSNMRTWYSGYQSCFYHLPKDAELTTELLVDWITSNTTAGSSRRRHYRTAAKRLAEFAGLPTDGFKDVSGKYGMKAVNPRSLPTDAEIVEMWRSIKDPGWKHLFGLQAAYGLRNHECFGLDYSDFPIIRVLSTAKTGGRPVKPLFPEWADLFDLQNPVYPRIKASLEDGNYKLGRTITVFFEKNIKVFHPYDLRHSYARRCVELQIPPDIGAKLMGHSLNLHVQVYRHWIGEAVYLSAVDKVLDNPNRPPAPM